MYIRIKCKTKFTKISIINQYYIAKFVGPRIFLEKLMIINKITLTSGFFCRVFRGLKT